MTGDARTAVMARIRAALRSSNSINAAHSMAVDVGQPATVGVARTDDLCARFARELFLVGGDAVIVAETGIDTLALAVADRVAHFGYHAIAVQRDALAMMAVSGVSAQRFFEASAVSAYRLEKSDCAIIVAESLIADSGSAVVRLSTYEERLLPYLPPACIIVGHTSRLSADLGEAALLAGDAERGERVIITGPSRTADIEKTVVLGAHGPRSLTVIIATDISK